MRSILMSWLFQPAAPFSYELAGIIACNIPVALAGEKPPPFRVSKPLFSKSATETVLD
jgi:hypothetical protein